MENLGAREGAQVLVLHLDRIGEMGERCREGLSGLAQGRAEGRRWADPTGIWYNGPFGQEKIKRIDL
jgi:hypothetical protein